ncbi:MAG TPA: hypothetical protein VGD02_01795 [Gemmatimonadaceae bacterium]
MRKIVAALSLVLLTASIGCGPELDSPSTKDITGHWSSSDRFGALSNISMDVTQDGAVIAGSWSGNSSPPDAPCPPGLGSTPTGPVNGTSTVAELQLSLLGAGDFDGQIVSSDVIRGSFVSCSAVYPLTFTRRTLAASGSH